MDDSPLPDAAQKKLNALWPDRLSQYDIVIVTDFGHGLLAGSTIELLTRKPKFLRSTPRRTVAITALTWSENMRGPTTSVWTARKRVSPSRKATLSLEVVLAGIAKGHRLRPHDHHPGQARLLNVQAARQLHRVRPSPVRSSIRSAPETLSCGKRRQSRHGPFHAGARLLGNAAGAIKVGIVVTDGGR